MRYQDARQLVRDNMEVLFSAQEKPNTFAMVEAMVFGKRYRAPGWARYNPHDAGEGLPFSASFGVRMATGRAVKRIARRVMRVRVLQIDVTVTGAKVEELEDGKSYVVPALAAVEEHVPPS